jgi:hypothetical protein
MTTRSVAHILPAHLLDMGGTQVKQPLPTQRVECVDPFLLLHHFGPTKVEPGGDPLDVGPHPHRGFEPVTFLYQGGIRHRDSRGNTGELRGGDVQWMTAGRGIIHSERASRDFLEAGGTMEGIQLWVNLPAAKKMIQPSYQDIKADRIPALEGTGYRVRVVAGELDGVHGPAVTQTPVNAWQVTLEPEGRVSLEIPAGHNAFLYILSGHLRLNDNFDYGGETGIYFRNDGAGIVLTGIEPSQVLVLTGEPIDEPVASWGPYVMNTQTEIMEAMRDYQLGKMGVYIDG